MGDAQERAVKRCACRADTRAERVRAALPELYSNATISDFDACLAQVAQRWVQEPEPPGLFIFGPVGTGKTHVAAAIGRGLIESDRHVIFRTAADYYASLRAAFNHGGATEREVSQHLMTCDILVLDDIAAGSMSDHERRSLLHLLDTRMNANRPSILTANLTRDEIADGMDERIASRLNSLTCIALKGRDMRRRK